ncbi:MAG: NlpC/P60 family protein, partial [archaeon]|nr:NlpC/P60 family protein [archaeon]
MYLKYLLCLNIFYFSFQSETGDKIYEAAKAQIGKYPYSWDGGDNYGPTTGAPMEIPIYCNDTEVLGFDCSGLAKYAVFQGTKVSLIHKASWQFRDAIEHGGEYVPVTEMERGDLIFYGENSDNSSIYHVTIYAGNNTMIEAFDHYDNCTGIPIMLSKLRTENLISQAVRYHTAPCDVIHEVKDNLCKGAKTEDGRKCCYLKIKNKIPLGYCKSFEKEKNIEEIKRNEDVEYVECDYGRR